MKGRRFEVDLRLIAAAVAALIAGLAVAAATSPPPTVEIVTAASAVAPGVPLADLELETRETGDPGGALLASDLDAVADHVLIAPLEAGDPLLASLLAPPSDRHGTVIGLTLRSEQAVHGALRAGDTVAVYVTRDELPPRRLASSTLVLAATQGTAGLGSTDVSLLLAVDDRLARDLIRAQHEAQLYLVRVGR